MTATTSRRAVMAGGLEEAVVEAAKAEGLLVEAVAEAKPVALAWEVGMAEGVVVALG